MAPHTLANIHTDSQQLQYLTFTSSEKTREVDKLVTVAKTPLLYCLTWSLSASISGLEPTF